MIDPNRILKKMKTIAPTIVIVLPSVSGCRLGFVGEILAKVCIISN